MCLLSVVMCFALAHCVVTVTVIVTVIVTVTVTVTVIVLCLDTPQCYMLSCVAMCINVMYCFVVSCNVSQCARCGVVPCFVMCM